ncbi:MAG: YlxR family protein [Candidatus Dormibacteraeota bacterium]|nr:YlxR family protein [Candidatus Dormibacteraeota bacterium]
MPKPPRREPVRTCVACREEATKRELVRLVRPPDGEVTVDLTGRAPGRGAYVHPRPDCVRLARRRRALERALGGTVPETTWTHLEAPPAGG